MVGSAVHDDGDASSNPPLTKTREGKIRRGEGESLKIEFGVGETREEKREEGGRKGVLIVPQRDERERGRRESTKRKSGRERRR